MSAALAATLPAITEEQLLRQVVDLATMYGWLVHHVANSTRLARRRSGALVRVRNIIGHAGVPDLLFVRAPRIIFAELKRDLGPKGGSSHRDLSPEQEEWARHLRAVSLAVEAARLTMVARDPHTDYRPRVEYAIWRPADLDDIARTLAR